MNPGSIVSCRNREWVLLPSDDDSVYLLRPLTGAVDDVVAVHKRLTNLIGGVLPRERVGPASFPLPTVADISDAGSAHLLWQAARLTLREGATPFRSLGRISVRPRVYQFVPLLMALRLDPVRLFIADDVGVGKTIEALLVAREMLERGEIKRVCVLAPPSLCDQWQVEMSQKMNLEPVVIRSGTVRQLERQKAGVESIYRYYPVQIASIDFVKSERNRHLFLQDCPELVIVDEAHGSAAAEGSESQQQRHALVKALAARHQHLILLTATPHSGVDAAFRSLTGLLDPQFADWEIGALNETQRTTLARHFVQRTRRDIEKDWEGEHCFPTRDPADRTYDLSEAYERLFARTYDFCSELVRTSASLDRRRQRVRYWGALALLRCVMSSPAAAVAALQARHKRLTDGAADAAEEFAHLIFESATEPTDDEQPLPAVEATEETLADSGRRRLRELAAAAGAIDGTPADTKLARCAEIVAELLGEGFNPIVWCRYIATAEAVASGLTARLARGRRRVQVVAVTSLVGDEEVRRAKIADIDVDAPRVLVATDCLSEGVNLQDKFNAALHYDLPWNPNRLEQREGRVDRYGQTSSVVRTIRFFGRNNPVDGVMIDVLLNKAREIHKVLGTHVPVPEKSETVTQAVLNALFLRGGRDKKDDSQLPLQFSDLPPEVEALHAKWSRDAERERVNRTRFAQRALKPAEVKRELEATDNVLGDPHAVREFVLSAAQRLGLVMRAGRRGGTYEIAIGARVAEAVPSAIAEVLPARGSTWVVSFDSPTPEGAEYLGRNHPLVAALARFLLEEALTAHGAARASRCGVLRTRRVTQRTTLLLMRLRHLVEQPAHAPLLAEQIVVSGMIGDDVIAADDALALLATAMPDENVDAAMKQAAAQEALDAWPPMLAQLRPTLDAHARELEASHKRIRQAVKMRVREFKVVPQMPPDLLGVLVLLPAADA